MYSFKEFIEAPLDENTSANKVMAELKELYSKAIKEVKNPDLVKKLQVVHDAVTKTSKKYNMPHDLILKSIDVDQFFRGE